MEETRIDRLHRPGHKGQSKPLCIAFDAKRLFLNSTGLGNYSRTLVKNFVEAYPDGAYHLFTPKAERNIETEFFFNHPGIFIHTPTEFFKSLWRSFGMSKEVNDLQPDIFHGLSHELPTGLDKSILQLVSFHDLIWEIYPKQFPLIDRWLYRIKYRNAARHAHHIVSVSKSTADDLKTFYHINEEKISVIYQACGSYFKTDQFSSDRHHFLYVGSIIERKGLDRVILALGVMPEEQRRPLVIVGSGKGSYFEYCKKLIDQSGLNPWIKFAGKVPNSELTKLYDEAIALVFPSIYEGFGIPVIEAIHRACPVITSNVSSLPEAGVALTTLVDPMEVVQISEAMANAAKNQFLPPPAKSIHEALAPFDGPYAAHKMMQLYQKLLK